MYGYGTLTSEDTEVAIIKIDNFIKWTLAEIV